MKLLITKGRWKWVGWFLEVSEPYAEILELDHDADDLSEADALAISRVPEMLAFIHEVKEHERDTDTYSSRYLAASALLEGVVEE